MKALITGGCGFLGHHVVEHIIKNTDWDIIIFDKLSYASAGFDRLRDINVFDDKRIKIFAVDLMKEIPVGVIKETGDVDYIFHLAAETHVDNSIDHPVPFFMNNVAATLNMLEYARKLPNLKLFINFSTDEVYGPAAPGVAYKEFSRVHPSNPYAGSKVAQEAAGMAYENTYKIPLINTHTMNLFGQRQHPEKFIPLVINKVLNGEEVTIHANKDKTKAGSRYYIHTRNVADALLHIISLGFSGYDEWNIAGIEEIDNLTLAQKIAEIIGKPLRYRMVDFHSSRPGHDLRYAMDSSKLFSTGYKYPKTTDESLRETVVWSLENPKWLGEAWK